MRAGLVIFSLVFVAACTPPDRVLAVHEVKENMITWHDKVVTVEGWLGVCDGFDCSLYPDKETLSTALSAEPSSSDWFEAYEQALSIGYDKEFDAKAARFQGEPVRIIGRVDRSCTSPFGTCLDRASDIHPVSISKINTQ